MTYSNLEAPFLIGRWWVKTVQSAKQTADEIGPTWRWIAVTILAAIMSGSVGFAAWTTSSINSLRELGASQAKEIEGLRAGIKYNYDINNINVVGLQTSLGEQKQELKEMNRLLQELNIKLARNGSSR